MLGRILAIIIIFLLLLSFIGIYTIIVPIVLFIVYKFIRVIADIFWWGKDKGKW